MSRKEPLLPVPASETFDDLRRIVADLRRECPWDRKQTHQSLAPHIIEEAYEAKEAIDRKDDDATSGELGDLLLHVLMHSTIASERNAFTFDDVVRNLAEKLIRRHPHVYKPDALTTNEEEITSDEISSEEVQRNWEQLKMMEGRTSIFDGMPKSLPALQRATRVQQKASAVGFDWPEVSGVWEKISEEIEEFRLELERSDGRDQNRVADEFGDLLFSLVNLSRFVGVDSESALHGTTSRFIERFRHVEKEAAASSQELSDLSIEELEGLWERAKSQL